jgi:hypothetical protein
MMMGAVRFDVRVPTTRCHDVPMLTDSSRIVHSTPFPIVPTIILKRPGAVVEPNASCTAFVGADVAPWTLADRKLVQGMSHTT